MKCPEFIHLQETRCPVLFFAISVLPEKYGDNFYIGLRLLSFTSFEFTIAHTEI
jgi:hypothetical protein